MYNNIVIQKDVLCLFVNSGTKRKTKDMLKKPSILIINISWITGGVERALCSICNELVKDYEVSVAVLFEIGDPGFEISNSVKIFSVANKKDKEQFLIDYIKQNDVEVVIGQSGIAPPFLQWYQRMLKEDIKVLVMNHEYYFYPFDNPYYNYGTDRINCLKDVLAVSFLTSFGEKTYRCFNDNGILMPNPTTFKPISATELKTKPFSKNIVAVGRLCDQIKRVDIIIEAFSLVKKQIPKATLTLVGAEDFDKKIEFKETGEKHSINELLNKFNIPESSILKITRTRTVEQYYNNADLFLLTSESEGFPMVLLEAAAFGVPSVITEIPGLEDIIQDGKNGYIVQKYHVESLAEKAVSLLSDNKLLTEFRENALKNTERFSLETIYKRWKELIELARNSNNQEFKTQIGAFQSDMSFSASDVKSLLSEYNKVCVEATELRKNPFVKTGGLLTNGIQAIKTKGFLQTLKIAYSMFVKR